MKVRKEFQITVPVHEQLRDKKGMPMVPLGKVSFFVLFAIVLVVIFLNFKGGDVKAALFKTPQNLGGEWTGTAQLHSFRKGMVFPKENVNKRAVLYLNLHKYDEFLNRFRGSGQLVIEGDSAPHRFDVSDLSADNDHSLHLTGSISGNDELSASVDGTIDNGSLHLTFKQTATVPGYDFTASVGRGTQADFDKLKNDLNQASGHSAGAGTE